MPPAWYARRIRADHPAGLPATGLVNALGVAVEPGLFSGLFFGGLVPLMRQLGRDRGNRTD